MEPSCRAEPHFEEKCVAGCPAALMSFALLVPHRSLCSSMWRRASTKRMRSRWRRRSRARTRRPSHPAAARVAAAVAALAAAATRAGVRPADRAAANAIAAVPRHFVQAVTATAILRATATWCIQAIPRLAAISARTVAAVTATVVTTRARQPAPCRQKTSRLRARLARAVTRERNNCDCAILANRSPIILSPIVAI